MSIEILAHRGWWLEPAEKNTFVAFGRAFDSGFGVETDLRDALGNVVISHDVPHSGEKSFDDFIALVSQYDFSPMLALNVKADGLQALARKGLGEYCNYFFFDMSVPDCLGYKKSGLTFYSRKSDIEEPSFYAECSGVWLDNFSSGALDVESLKKYLMDGKRVALVSPELHGFEYNNYWALLKEFIVNNPKGQNQISLCTDYPGDAKEYFDGE